MNIDICTICLDNIDIKDNQELRCGHVFHTKCIIRWFRQSYVGGKCPLCLDNPSKMTPLRYYGYNLNSHIIDCRCSTLKKYSKKNEENIKLKIQIDKLNIFEKDILLIKDEINIFHKDENYHKIKKKSKELSKKLRNKNTQLQKLKCNLFANYPTLTI